MLWQEWRSAERGQERGKPTPTTKKLSSRNQNKNVQQYYDRLKAWADEQLQKNAPKYRDGDGEDNIHDFLKRITAFTEKINGKVTDVELKEKDVSLNGNT